MLPTPLLESAHGLDWNGFIFVSTPGRCTVILEAPDAVVGPMSV